MTRSAFAPGKIILSGEYAVVFGYRGIAVPSSMGMTAIFEEDSTKAGITIEWPGVDPRWKEYAEKIAAMCMEEKRLKGVVHIQNELPLGKGMGSSTSCVISVAKSLLGNTCNSIAKEIESTLNRGNSGLDFTVIWEGKPVIFEKGKDPKPLTRSLDFMKSCILFDTGTPHEPTTELVAWMKTREGEVKEHLAMIGRCTERFIAGEDVMTVMHDHHRAQAALGVVRPEALALIEEIESLGGAAKVLGAGGRTGGGGMVLGMHSDPKVLVNLAQKRKISVF